MRIKDKKRFTISISIVIAILVGIIAGIIVASKDNKKSIKPENSIPLENETENLIVVEVATEEKSKKVDFLANVTTPMYKKNEKDIKIPIIIYHAFATPAPAEDIYKLYSTGPRFEENVSTMLNDGYTFISLEELYKYNKGNSNL